MSNLKAFLSPVQGEETKEIIISRRFVGEDGKPVPFKIRALSQEENDRITKLSMHLVKGGKRREKQLDEIEYSRRLVLTGTVEPDFSQEEMCKAYGTMDPLEVPGKMLLAGEYNRLGKEIMALSGFDSEGVDDVEDDAKN